MDKKIIQKIRDFYHPEAEGELIRFYVNGEKKILSVRTEHPIILVFGAKAKTREEALAAGGIEVDPKELYAALFPEKWEKIKPRVVMDDRTAAYLKKIKHNIGLTEVHHGWDGIKIKIEEQYKIWPYLTGSGYVDVGLDDQGRWVAQYCYRTDIDDYNITSLFFTKKPSIRDIKTADLLDRIEHYFAIRGYDQVYFTCWECGVKSHWLDIVASRLEERWNFFKERYCGC